MTVSEFTSSPATEQQQQPNRRWLVAAGIGAIGVVVVVVGFLIGQALAGSTFGSDVEALESALKETKRAQEEAAVAADALDGKLAAAQTVLDAAAPDLVDEAAAAALGDGAASASTVSEDTRSAATAALPKPPKEQPFWLWELLPVQAQVRADTAEVEAVAKDATTGATDTSGSVESLDELATEVFSSTGTFVQPVIDQNISAQAPTVIAFRRAAEQVPDATELTTETAGLFASYSTAADVLRASQESELAEKQGPLLQQRLEVEEFARSLSGGVLLDFDWALLVNGYGLNGSMSGEARWWYEDGGYSTIRLSDSVAQEWPNERSKALVAHEVGHSITAKCVDILPEHLREDRATLEAWATAWAIGLGFTSEANGVQAYGYPSQELIDLAMGCR